MKRITLVLPLLALAGCNTPAAPKVDNAAVNASSNDEITEVPDDSASANSDRDNLVAGAIGNSSTNIVDPD